MLFFSSMRRAVTSWVISWVNKALVCRHAGALLLTPTGIAILVFVAIAVGVIIYTRYRVSFAGVGVGVDFVLMQSLLLDYCGVYLFWLPFAVEVVVLVWLLLLSLLLDCCVVPWFQLSAARCCLWCWCWCWCWCWW